MKNLRNIGLLIIIFTLFGIYSCDNIGTILGSEVILVIDDPGNSNTVEVTVGGIPVTNSGSITVEVGDAVTLTAVPSTGYQFTNWSRDISGTDNPYTFFVKGNTIISAIFEPLSINSEIYSLTIATETDGHSYTVTNSADSSITYSSGDSILKDTELTITAIPATGYSFDGWVSGSSLTGTTNPVSLTVTGDVSIDADFSLETVNPVNYTLTIATETNGHSYTVTNSADSNITYSSGDSILKDTELTITAIPATGYSFDSWASGSSLSGTLNPATLTVIGDVSIDADFSLETVNPVNYTLSLATETDGHSYTVSDGTTTYSDGASVPENTELTITAIPATGYSFEGWASGSSLTGNQNPATLTVMGEVSIDADFSLETVNPVNYTLSIATETDGHSYTVTETADTTKTYGNGASIPANTELTITAVPATGYTFDGWATGGSLTGTTNPVSLTVTGDISIDADFNLETYVLSLALEGNDNACTVSDGTTSFTDGDMIPYGTELTITAVPAAHYVFDGWASATSLTGSASPYTLEVIGEVTIDGDFSLETYVLNLASEGNGNACTVTAGTTTYANGDEIPFGTELTITANAGSGYAFSEWASEGSLSGTTNPAVWTVDGDFTVDADFVETYTLTLTDYPGQGTITAYIDGDTSRTFASGDEIPDGTALRFFCDVNTDGYRITRWEANESFIGNQAESNRFEISENATITAEFVEYVSNPDVIESIDMGAGSKTGFWYWSNGTTEYEKMAAFGQSFNPGDTAYEGTSIEVGITLLTYKDPDNYAEDKRYSTDNPIDSDHPVTLILRLWNMDTEVLLETVSLTVDTYYSYDTDHREIFDIDDQTFAANTNYFFSVEIEDADAILTKGTMQSNTNNGYLEGQMYNYQLDYEEIADWAPENLSSYSPSSISDMIFLINGNFQ